MSTGDDRRVAWERLRRECAHHVVRRRALVAELVERRRELPIQVVPAEAVERHEHHALPLARRRQTRGRTRRRSCSEEQQQRGTPQAIAYELHDSH